MVDVILRISEIKYDLEQALRKSRSLTGPLVLPLAKSFAGECHGALTGLLRSLTRAEEEARQIDTNPLDTRPRYHSHTVSGE